MPLRQDIKKVLVIGSGPIIIGQAAEFDYAGAQACTALKEEGLEVVLINSNPATIMTDKAMADHIYIEPLTLESVNGSLKLKNLTAFYLHWADRPVLLFPCSLQKKDFLMLTMLSFWVLIL